MISRAPQSRLGRFARAGLALALVWTASSGVTKADTNGAGGAGASSNQATVIGGESRLMVGGNPLGYQWRKGTNGADLNRVPAQDQPVLLFSFFREPNGTAGLYLATSTDGLKWTELQPPNGKSFLEPRVGGKLMRDPCLRRGPDGVFRMVWTTSWGQPPVFGYASSTDLVHWSPEQAVPVMENDPTAQNVWAPELFYDDVKQQWLIFWATTVPGKFPETANSGDGNHRIYYVTTKDFTRFSPTRLLYDGGFNVIDATLMKVDGKYDLIVKDETKNPVKKNLRLAVGDSAEGPFGPAGPPISISWVEGPTAVQIGADYYIYYDQYGAHHFGGIKSTDMKSWRDISQTMTFPKGIRHGTVSWVPESIIEQVKNH